MNGVVRDFYTFSFIHSQFEILEGRSAAKR